MENKKHTITKTECIAVASGIALLASAPLSHIGLSYHAHDRLYSAMPLEKREIKANAELKFWKSQSYVNRYNPLNVGEYLATIKHAP